MKAFSHRHAGGFTLLELLIVVVVLAVLAGLALPQYLKTIARAKEAEGWRGLGEIRLSELRYYGEYDTGTATVGNLDIEDPNTLSPRYFNYAVSITGASFAITATPTAGAGRTVGNVRTLTLDKAGVKSP